MFVLVRQSLRQLISRWHSVALSVSALGLATALVTASFAIVDGVFWKRVRLQAPEELAYVFRVRNAKGQGAEQPLTVAEVDALRASGMFAAVAAIGPGSLGLSEETSGVRHHQVSPEFFETLGVRPLFGDIFRPTANAGPLAQAIISFNLWQRPFGGVLDIVGKRAQIDDQSFEVVGVMPPGFDFPNAANVWTPLHVPSERRSFAFLYCLVRIPPGSSVDAAHLTEIDLTRGGPLRQDITLRPIDREDPDRLLAVLLFGVCAITLLLGWVQALGAQLIAVASGRSAMAIHLWLGAGLFRSVLPFGCQAAFISIASSACALLLTNRSGTAEG